MVVLLSINALTTILLIGQRRKPITNGGAAWNAAFNLFFVVWFIVALVS